MHSGRRTNNDQPASSRALDEIPADAYQPNASDGAGSGRPAQKPRRGKRFRISAIATAVILATGVGFGVGR